MPSTPTAAEGGGGEGGKRPLEDAVDRDSILENPNCK